MSLTPRLGKIAILGQPPGRFTGSLMKMLEDLQITTGDCCFRNISGDQFHRTI